MGWIASFRNMGNRVSTNSDSIAIRIGSIEDCDSDQNEAGTATPTVETDGGVGVGSGGGGVFKKNYTKSKARNKKPKRPIANNRVKSTNYTIVTFLPKNLIEQFQRIANFYFLIMTIIVVGMGSASPVSWWTSLAPLAFVISVTAIKQGYEDYLRHLADNLVNRSFVTVIRNGVEIDIKCEDILQGDLVKASRDCDVPCDLVLLKTSDPDAKCYVTTANLDGETNLKTLFVPKGFPNDVSIEKLHNIGSIECDQPLADLYTFNGRLEIGPTFFWRQNREPTFSDTLRRHRRTLPLTADHLLLRGSRIKNTEWAIGCAVYTGQQTKLALNGQVTRPKNSSSEKFINHFILFFILVMVALVVYCFSIKVVNDSFRSMSENYLGKYKVEHVHDFLSFLILFNYLIPISLYVTIELHKFLGSLFLEWDPDLYDEEMNQQCIVNTSNLNEDLGQVRFLFSDKTGTLTKNEMTLQQCSINGKMYKIESFGVQEADSPNVIRLPQYDRHMLNFFQVLSACHTVQVAKLEPEAVDKDDAEGSESSFEAVDSSGKLIDIEEDARQKEETRQNTKANEVTVPMNLLNEMPTYPELRREHRRVASTSSKDRRISFNKDRSNLAFRENFPIPSRDFAPKIPSPLSIDHPTPFTPRPEYKRTMSTKVHSLQERKNFGHRRTQSLNTPQTQINSVYGGKNDLKKSVYNRSSSNIANSREYYAAPAYNEATLLERRESMRISATSYSAENVKFDYQASSPDEKALVEGCAKVGFLFTGEQSAILNIQLQNQRANKTVTYSEIFVERLSTLEFTSDRKRMSVIVRDTKGDIWLYTKGAESHVFPLCMTSTPSQIDLMRSTLQHIDDFAKIGLRTLAVARRKLTSEEYQAFEIDMSNAGSALANRKALVDAVQSKIERDLELLGATAVEDALQDNVKDTLESLRRAGIIIWVLTGDKIETALNIAKSCGHIPDKAQTYFITECKEESQILQHMDSLAEELMMQPYVPYSLLIDGMSLSLVMKHCAQRFRDLSTKCQAVLCCRLSPLQKCEVVKLMKTLPDTPITAAIGDGANDVSMIQEAHVGLGIVGKEGRQAALCSDYSFSNFCMLKKILLVHGHYFSYRFSLLVLYFFYKNLVFILIQVYFQVNNRFSTQSVYDSIYMTFYNVLYTSCPILVLSITEKPYHEEQLMKHPSLYQKNAGNKRLTWKHFLAWITLSIYHSLAVYYAGYMVFDTDNMPTTDFDSFGTFMIHNVVFVVTLKLWLIARYQTLFFIMTIIGSILAFIISTLLYNVMSFIPGLSLYFVYNRLIITPAFWEANLLICIASLLPDYVIMALKMFNIKVRPTDTIPELFADGWNRLFPRDTKTNSERSASINHESTYL